jgi:hypothetical protein
LRLGKSRSFGPVPRRLWRALMASASRWLISTVRVLFCLPYREGRAGQSTIATAVCFMVSRHASNEEVEQEGLLGIGGAVEHGEFVVCVGDDLLLVVCRLLVLLK